jgi:hypothetical protein
MAALLRLWVRRYNQGEHERTSPMSASPSDLPTFDGQYRSLSKAIFDDIARAEIARGADSDERARAYAARGKPEFVLAFLLLGSLGDDEKRALYAAAYDQRAEHTERKASEFDRQFHRPFPLLAPAAAHDRAIARQIRAGQPFQPGAGKQLPMI